MTANELKFYNDIVAPWISLNDFLIQPYAVEPKLSIVTQAAGNIATNLSHFPETIGLKRLSQSDRTNLIYLIDDLADSLKHGTLSNPARQSELFVKGYIEIKEEEFGFLRNAIIFSHATHGETDFMEFSSVVIQHWEHHLGVNFNLSVRQNTPEFGPRIKLEYDNRYCAQIKSVTCQVFEKDDQGILQVAKVRPVQFEIFQDENKNLTSEK